MHPEQVLIVADWFKQNAQWRSTFEAEVESSLLLNILVSLDSVLDAMIKMTKIMETFTKHREIHYTISFLFIEI